MIYIYNCYGGTHSSILSAAVHLKKLPLDRVPTREEILNTDSFNRLKYKDMGRIIFHGVDDEGSKVFTVGRGTSKVLVPCLKELIQLLQTECGLSERIILANSSPVVPPAMTLGGFFSRGLGIDFIGVPLLVKGSKQTYHKILEFVDTTRKTAKESTQRVLVLQAKS